MPVDNSRQGWTPPDASGQERPQPSPGHPQPYPGQQSGPYPPYPPYHPYGMPQPPYGMPPRPATNGFAIGALVAGIVCCLPPLGLVLGLIALVQIRKKGEEGRGLAIAGAVLSVISTMLVTVALATGGVGAAWDGFREAAERNAQEGSAFDLRTGQCFNSPDGLPEEEETAFVDVVSCTAPHDAEVSGTYTLHEFDSWPGESAIDSLATEKCDEVNNAYTLDWWAVPDNAETGYYMPTRDSWRFGDRTVTCTFGAIEGKLTASVRSDSTTLAPEQLAYLETEAAVEEVVFEESADEFGDDPQAARAWARQVSKELAAQARALREEPWPDKTAGAAAVRRAMEFDTAGGHWARAAGARDESTFWEHRYAAEGSLLLTTEIAVRSALGLPSEPPDWLVEEDEAADPEWEEL
ncbi:DUF4190 domain-containing protein [Streptomyces sp. FIT100]|uniref:DUF4190 domain-containing protein n=1 Tax=Streptomyces sp. FIT100 TaxID=2837956 RepID=UPI0021CAA5E3|nr:DUF4190 domain-containing protein [Streptomyces sp. FIT100]